MDLEGVNLIINGVTLGSLLVIVWRASRWVSRIDNNTKRLDKLNGLPTQVSTIAALCSERHPKGD